MTLLSSAKLRTITLGCKVNQYETEYLHEGLARVGYEEAEPGEAADLCIVNTCTVTAEGDAKSRQVIRRLARENPGAPMIVMGCYATRAPDEVALLPGVSEVVRDKRELPDILSRFGVLDVPTGISGFRHRHRAYVKIQDGCLLRCSFCIIPKVRPQMYSRPVPHVLDEVRRLVDNGYREIVLTGIHLGHYGVDWNARRPKSEWIRLSDLLRRVVGLGDEFRVRLSSMEATELTRELIDTIGEFPDQICPHLHLCMQSGSDAVLRRMNRRWGAKRFVDRCHLARECLDQPALTSDVIVGFPGETEKDFADTCRAVQECGFSKVHVFPFSARRGTPAAQMPGQLPKRVRTARSQHLSAIVGQLRLEYFQSLRGRQLRVLVEAPVAGMSGQQLGTACRYAPVQLPASAGRPGQLARVTATHIASDRIIGYAPPG